MLIILNIALPILAGVLYFAMAYEIRKSNRGRTLIMGELTIKGTFYAYVALGLWLLSRPLQNIIGPHPAPLVVNCVRQFLMMSVFAPYLLVAIFNWTSEDKKLPKIVQAAVFTVALFMGLIFVLINIAAVDGSKIIAQNSFITLYDAQWFLEGPKRLELVLIHLFVQGISPVGFCLFAAGIVRHKRHNYPKDSVYNMMTRKWLFLEVSLIIFACSMLVAGFAALLTGYGTYLWVIYFAGAIVAGFFDMKGIKLPPRIEKRKAELRNRKLIIPVLSLVVALIAAAAAATNIEISNSGFESGNLTGWSANSTSISASGDRAYGGSFYSCRFKDPTSSFDGRRLNSTAVNLVTATDSSSPSDHYAFSLSAWFYVVDETDGEVEDTKIQFYVKWYDASQNDLGNDTGYLSGTVLSAFDSWEKLELPLMAAPANAVYASVFIAVRETVNHNNDVYVDNVSFAYEPLPAYLKTLGLRTFDPSSGDALKVFFPYSTPAGKASSCRIVFNLPTAPVTLQRVNVLVYDVKGRLVRAIIKGEEFLAQHYNYIWDGRDVNQEFLPVGMYIISVEVADQDTGGVIKEQTAVAIGRKL